MLDQELIAAALPLYEVYGELGRGAWGVVLAGRHRELGRDVAIKQLPRAFGADPAVRTRFVAEARLLAALDHAHIVRIYDFVEHEGLCLLVIERLTGGTVWSRFKSGALNAQRSCAVGLASCSALHYAHQHGVLHRDVKPENLMFSSEAVLKITDFGIAKVLGGSVTVATRAGDVLGTPAYMAPEQAQGGALSPATDVYSLGTVLYELFSGRLPFPEETNPLATLYRHVHEVPEPLQRVAPHIPTRLAEVTGRALSTDLADRYPSAEAFGVALAEAAAEGWGPGWLAESGIVVAASGAITGAAIGRSRSAETVTVTGSNGSPGTGDALAATPDQGRGEPTPADLVPVNLLRPSMLEPGPVIEGASSAPPASDTPGADPANGTATRQPDAPPPPGRSPAPSGHHRKGRLAALGTAAVVLVAALVGIGLAIGTGSGRTATNARASSHPGATAPPTSRAGSPTASSSPAPVVSAAAWRKVPPMPTARQQMQASVVGGMIWVVGGLAAGGSTPKVEGYDPVIDTWQTGPDLPLALNHDMVVTYHGELVVLGGWVPSGADLTATASNQVFALRNGAWVQLPPMIDARAAGAAAVVGNRIVVFGGQANHQLLSSVDVFDGAHWVQAAPLPTPRDHLAGVSDGRYVYAVGGRALSADKNSGAFERYDPVTGRWTRLPDLPTPRGGLGATLVDGKLITAGGEFPTSVSASVESFDLSSDTWSAGPALPTPRHGIAMATYGSTVYAFGGALQPGHTASTNVVEALDFVPAGSSSSAPVGAAAWRRVPAMPTARQMMQASVVGGMIWVAGGLTTGASTESSAKVEGYDPVVDTWQSGPDLPLALNHDMVVTYHGELVVLGGWVPSGADPTATASNQVFALRNGAWVQLPPMIDARAAGAAAVVGNQIVVFGGQANHQLLSSVDVFDGTHWFQTAPLPTPRDHLAGVSDGHFAYAVGGRALSVDKNSGAFERYDPVTGRWTRLPDLPTPRGGLGATLVGNKLVTAGGELSTSASGAVEIFNFSTNTWSGGPALPTPRHG
ncbi:MAG TPA: kelch repeat-containing protein, partial [Acidimicrobiales bacterium]|nr:kelch repeat-containing protein [Acidimicrobiales bacterium]